MDIKILTDAAAEFSPKQCKELGIFSLDMPVNYDDKEIVHIDIKEFWQLQMQGKRMRTSQPSREVMAEQFKRAKEGGYALICILISSALSGTYESAVAVKNEVGYDGVYIFDSLNATIGEHKIVVRALELIKEGLEPDRIIEELTAFRGRVKLFASIDSLKYLALGGRLSDAAAHIGNLINLKPIIYVNECGEVKVAGKKIGLGKTMHAICDMIDKSRIDLTQPIVPIFAHSDENVKTLIKRFTSPEVEGSIVAPVEIGHVIGTHIGPGGFGIVYVEK